MKIRNGQLTAFGFGLLAGMVFPACWTAVLAAVIFVIALVVLRRSGKCCC